MTKTNQTIITVGSIISVIALILVPTLTHAQAVPPVAAPGLTIDQRIAQRKAEQKITLDERDSKRLADTCVNTQSKIRAMQQNTTTALNKRTQVFQQIDGRLWVMVGKLKLAQKDTFELEKERSEYAKKVTAYSTVGDNYKQTLDDIVLINCKADPAGFKSLLLTARGFQAGLRTQSADIKSYLVDTVRPTLSSFANDLKPKTSEDQ